MSRVDEANSALRSPEQRLGERMGRRSSAEVLQRRLIEQEIANLDNAFTRVTADGSAVRAAALIVAARRRFITGAGKSLAYATLLAADLTTSLSQVTLVDGSVVRHVDLLADVRQTDVLLAFSFRRYRASTVHVAEAYRKAGGQLVVITDSVSAPLANVADEAIVVETASASYADSATAVAAISLLVSTLATARAKGAARRMHERTLLAERLDLYLPEGTP